MYLSKDEECRYAELQFLALEYARQGETRNLQKMISHGLPVNLSDAKGNSLIMLASYNGNEDTVRMLLGFSPDIDRRNSHGQTPLGGVAFKGYATIAEMLIDAGADVNADNGMGKTPLMFAAMFGHEQLVRSLLDAGADPALQTVMGISVKHLVKFTGAVRSFTGL